MNNNPTKGGVPGTFQIVKSSPGLEDFWQLHYSDNVGKEVNSAEQFIANFTGNGDAGHYIKLSARNDGSFTVTNARNSVHEEYRPRRRESLRRADRSDWKKGGAVMPIKAKVIFILVCGVALTSIPVRAHHSLRRNSISTSRSSCRAC